MKAKATHLIPAQTAYSVASIKEAGSSSSYRKRRETSDSDQSSYSKNRSDRSSESRRRSRSRTSRSRSYSKSYSRSRSPSSSRSRSRSRSTARSRSANKFPSDQSFYSGSSSYFSLSDDDRQKVKRRSESREKSEPSSKKRQSSSESTLPYTKEAVPQKLRESGSRSSLDFSTDSEQPVKPQLALEKGQSQPDKANRKQDKSGSACDRQEERSRSEWGSDRSKRRGPKDKSESPGTGRKAKRKTHAGSKWDSGSNSERGGSKNDKEGSRLSSGKEEGEATSDSDSEVILSNLKVKTDPSSEALKTGKRPSSPSDSGSSLSNLGTRGKSRKQKHGPRKNLKKAHSKKAKEKSKGKKEKKQKAQKQKETFHWQPPLEFGEEEEDEDIAVKPATNDKKATAEAKEKNRDQASETNRAAKEQPRNDEKLREVKTPADDPEGRKSPVPNKRRKDNEGQSTSAPPLTPVKNADVSRSPKAPKANGANETDVTQIDDMEICTPDRNSPAKVDLDLSPVSPKGAAKVTKKSDPPNNSEAETVAEGVSAKEAVSVREERSKEGQKQGLSPTVVTAVVENVLKAEVAENAQGGVVDNKWKPLQGVGNLQATAAAASPAEARNVASLESKPQGLRIEIKSKNKIRPGSLFDEVRKTARLNRRPRNRESSSEEDSPARENSQSRSRSRSRSKSDLKSRHRTRSLSYSHSRSRSRSSTYSYRWVELFVFFPEAVAVSEKH